MAITSKTLARFKRCATAVLNSIDCSTTWLQMSNLIQLNKTAVAENK